MKKFIEAKEKKGCSYREIAEAVGNGYPDAQSVANFFHHKRCASLELLAKIGGYLGLSHNEIQEAYLENRIVFIEKELESKKAELKRLQNSDLADKKNHISAKKPKKHKTTIQA